MKHSWSLCIFLGGCWVRFQMFYPLLLFYSFHPLFHSSSKYRKAYIALKSEGEVLEWTETTVSSEHSSDHLKNFLSPQKHIKSIGFSCKYFWMTSVLSKTSDTFPRSSLPLACLKSLHTPSLWWITATLGLSPHFFIWLRLFQPLSSLNWSP